MSSFFKGAVSTVGAGVGAAASVVGVGNNRRGSTVGLNEIVLREKMALTVKETANKDAQSINAISIRSGFLSKRNEQGVWQKRYCCLVPHMFLYYFENEVAESPRGIIDLEYFTEVDIQSGNILKLSPASHVQANNGFFFQIDDPAAMNDWMGSLHRDRYATVRDERDAYQQLQDQFSGQMDMTSKMLEESAAEKEKLSYEVASLQREIAAAKLALHQVLTRVTVISNSLDIPTNDEEDDFDTNKMGQSIKDKLEAIKTTYDEKINAVTEASSMETGNLRELVLQLQGEVAAESQARRQAEAQVLQDKRESDMKIREAISQLEKANHSYQMIWNMKSGLEEKLSKNSEQKKVLVKEVKHLRKRIEESEDLNDQVSEVNDKLIAVTTELRTQVENQQKKIEFQNQLMLESTDSTLHETIRSSSEKDYHSPTDPESLNPSEEAKNLISESKSLTAKVSQLKTGDEQNNSNPSDAADTDIKQTNHGNSNEVDQLLLERSESENLPNPSVDIVTRGGRTESMDWEFATDNASSSLLNMEWLSPEQRQLAEQRQQQSTASESVDSKGEGIALQQKSDKRSSIAIFKNITANVSGSMKSKISGLHLPGTKDKEKEKDHEEEVPQSGASVQSGAETGEENDIGSHSGQANSFVDASYVNGGKPTCFRCGGTVEGPKYSTCKCDVPAMSPLSEEEMEREEHGIHALKGFFKKGSSLASVAKKKGFAVGKDLFHRDSHHGHSSTGSLGPSDEIASQTSGNDSPVHFASKKGSLLDLDDDPPLQQKTQEENSTTKETKSLLDL